MKLILQVRRAMTSHDKMIYGLLAVLIMCCPIVAEFFPQDDAIMVDPGVSSVTNPDIQFKPYPTDLNQTGSTIPPEILELLSPEDRQKLNTYLQQNQQLPESDLTALQDYKEQFDQLFNPNRSSQQLFTHYSEQWTPQTITTMMNASSTELPDFQSAFQSIFSEEWARMPLYTPKTDENSDIVITTSQDEQYAETITQVTTDDQQLRDVHYLSQNQEINERSITTPHYNITTRTEITGTPRVTLIEPDLSEFEDLKVPILSPTAKLADASESSDTANTEWLQDTFRADIGFDIEFPGFNEEITLDAWIIRLRAWAIFETRFRLMFPVQVVVNYPAEVYKGGDYTFNVTIIPMDRPDYNEFEFVSILDIGAGLDIKVPYIKWKYFTIKIPYFRRWRWRWRRIKIWYPVLRFRWAEVFNWPLIDHNITRLETYKTPMLGEHVDINLGYDFDVLPIIGDLHIPYVSSIAKVLSIFMETGPSLGVIHLYGKAISSELGVFAGEAFTSEKVATWQHGHDTQIVKFTTPFSEEPYLNLRVSDLVFHSGPITWSPEFFLRFKEVNPAKVAIDQFSSKTSKDNKTTSKKAFELIEKVADILPPVVLPLDDWLGEFRFVLPFELPIALGGLNIPCLETYSRQTSRVSTQDIYDFSMEVADVTPEADILTSVSGYDQLFEISLQNLVGKTDIVELAVSDLPEGYTATFDRAIPNYEVSGLPNTVNLVISPPTNIEQAPGEYNFKIHATSQGKKNLGLANDTLIKTATIIVPEIVKLDFGLDLTYHPAEMIQVDPDMYVPVDYSGQNLGNRDDNVTVTASLYSSNAKLGTWQQNYSVTPYGSGTGQFFEGGFNFTYSKDDLYPEPGLYTLEVNASSDRSPTLVKTIRRVLNFTNYYDMNTTLTPTSTTMFANFETNFTLSLTNLGNARTNFTLTSNGWDEFLTFPTRVELEPLETREISIELEIGDPSSIPPKWYNFRITTTAEGSQGAVYSIEDVAVQVLEPDYVPPGLEFIEETHAPDGFIYPQSAQTFNLTWIAYDQYPNEYTVYINGSVYETNTWLNGTAVHVPVTGSNNLAVGTHNVTITFTDTSNNVATAQQWITIVPTDVTAPTFTANPTSLTLPLNFNTSPIITWNCTEPYPYKVDLLLNGTEHPFDNLYIQQDIDDNTNFTAEYTLQPGLLTAGTWNLTLWIQDMSLNAASYSVFITIEPADTDPPEITTYPSESAILDNNDTLTFTATDAYSHYYELWINATKVLEKEWQSGIPETLLVEELNLVVGDNPFKLVIFDLSGQETTYEWTFTYQDIDPPTILHEPSDFTVPEHLVTVTNVPYWQLSDGDIYPGTYEIYLESVPEVQPASCDALSQTGELIAEGNWTASNSIVKLPKKTLIPGTYSYNVHFKDASGNTAFSSVEMTVVDVTAPYVWPIDPIRYEPLYTASWFEFFILEKHLESYELYVNDVLQEAGSLSEDFPYVLVDLSDLATGSYTFRLEVTDKSANVGVGKVEVVVTDAVPPYVKRPEDRIISEGSTGNTITWEILEANPNNYSIYVDAELHDTGVLTSNSVSFSLDGLSLGTHTLNFIVYDNIGQSHSVTTLVVVLDLTAPKLTHLGDCCFGWGDIDMSLVWEVTELHPSAYTIAVDDSIIVDSSWDGEPIELKMTGWSLGTYRITVRVFDSSANQASDTVTVEIVQQELISSSGDGQFSYGFTLINIMTIIVLVGIFRLKRWIKKS